MSKIQGSDRGVSSGRNRSIAGDVAGRMSPAYGLAYRDDEIQHVRIVAELLRGVSPSARVVYEFIRARGGWNGGDAALAALLGYCERTINRAWSELRELVKVELPKDANGFHLAKLVRVVGRFPLAVIERAKSRLRRRLMAREARLIAAEETRSDRLRLWLERRAVKARSFMSAGSDKKVGANKDYRYLISFSPELECKFQRLVNMLQSGGCDVQPYFALE